MNQRSMNARDTHSLVSHSNMASSSSKRDELLGSLPGFDPDAFKPPAWAKDFHKTNFGDGGGKPGEPAVTLEDSDEDDDEEEVWEDALEAHEPFTEPDFLRFTDDEMQRLFDKGLSEKERGNALFTSQPPDTEQALEAYKQGLDYLPTCGKPEAPKSPTVPPPLANSGIQEVTEDEAAAIEAEAGKDTEAALTLREKIEEDIRQLQKVLWANVGACYTRMENHKETAKACSKSLEIDPDYVKALQRRAHASERLGSSAGLETAKDDHVRLLRLLPPNSPGWQTSKRALATLPSRITEQQTKEKDEMLGKLKELGNGLLGNFGLHTDMFKFEQQPGGGYGLKFER